MFLGIDVSKKTLDVALLADAHTSTKPRHKVFPNTSAGHQQLLRWLQSHNATLVHACLEDTGTLGEAVGEAVALALHQAEHKVSIVNPLLLRGFSQSQLSRTKTDKADSLLIARFCAMHQPPLWNPPDPAIRELQALVRRLETLAEMRLMEENRLESGVASPEVRASLQEHIAYLQAQIEKTRRQIEKTRRQIKDHIDQNPTLKTLKEQHDLLTSIPGIGDATAALLLAEVDSAQFGSARQVAAFAGLVPRIRQSGTSVRGRSRLSKAGSSRYHHD